MPDAGSGEDVVGPLRLLIVEDDPADRELILAELERAGLEFTVDTTDRLEGVRGHLDASRYDVILADYQLRAWRGTEVLAELARRGLEVPVILVTGTIGEEFADQCIRLGATDFVLKHSLTRLPIAVRRAWKENKRREEHGAALERLRTLSVAVDQGPAAVIITDTMGRMTYVNARFSEITGYSADEAIGQTPRLLRSGRTSRALYENLWRTVLGGHAWRSEVLNRRKNGELYWSLVSISPMKNAAGAVTHFVAVHEDISERRWAEDAIREREERLRQITENIGEVCWVVAADFSETLYISPAYEKVWGRSCRSVYEMPASFMEAVHPDDRHHLIANITSVRAGEDPGTVDFRVVRPDASERWVRAHAAPVLDEHGQVYRISGVALDISERHEAEQRVIASEERFRMLADTSFDVIVVTVEGRIHELNAGFERVLGHPRERAIGRSALDFVADGSREDVRRRLESANEERYELELLHRDGHTVLMEATARGLDVDGQPGRITALRDITRVRALETQFRQAQKLEAVARLAGGVAHDFNNLLTVILTEVQLLKIADDPEAMLAGALDDIEGAAKRAAALTRQLLTFSRHDVAEPEVLNPGEVLEGLKKMLVRLIGEDVRVVVSVAPDPANVLIDRGHLEQVIVNLAINARDAMPAGGELRIELVNVEIEEAQSQALVGVPPGRYALIAVSDTGVGMTDAVQARIFEPFFTTKPSGKGTGLGLATSYGIVKDAAGHIGVYSEVGIGTTMKVYLPRAAGQPDATRLGDVQSGAHGPLAATVLLVEDDEAVRRSAERALRGLGCEVHGASSAAEALEQLRTLERAPDLVFTDVVMPDLSGPALGAKIRELYPDIRILYTTGYTGDMATRHMLLEEGADILMKPYSTGDLARRIRTSLGK